MELLRVASQGLGWKSLLATTSFDFLLPTTGALSDRWPGDLSRNRQAHKIRPLETLVRYDLGAEHLPALNNLAKRLRYDLINMSELQGKDSANNADADTGSTQKTFPKKFVFVADNSTEERKKARVHTVREHHRRRKWQDVNAPNPRIQMQLSWRRKEGYPAAGEDPVDATEALTQQPDSTLSHSSVVSGSVCRFSRLSLALSASLVWAAPLIHS